MTQLNGYRLSTAIFALLFAAMVVRDLARPEPETVPPAVPEAGARMPSAPALVDSAEGAPVADATDESSAPPGSPEVRVPALDLAMQTLIRGRGRGANWSTVLPKLRPRRKEIIPILEDWLRRREELARQDVDLRNVPRAYAELAGVAAVPLLEEVLAHPGRRWSIAVNEALPWIDDPAAANLIRRHQESLPEGHSDVHLNYMWKGSSASRELLKDWARKPPANTPVRGVSCRSEWFRRGTAEEREEVWGLMDDLERLNALSGAHARSWGRAWPARYDELTTAGLSSRDPRIRCRAIFNVIADAAAASPELLAEAEAALDHEIDAAEGRPMSEGPTQRSLLSLRRSHAAWRERTEAEERKRELLAPR